MVVIAIFNSIAKVSFYLFNSKLCVTFISVSQKKVAKGIIICVFRALLFFYPVARHTQSIPQEW